MSNDPPPPPPGAPDQTPHVHMNIPADDHSHEHDAHDFALGRPLTAVSSSATLYHHPSANASGDHVDKESQDVHDHDQDDDDHDHGEVDEHTELPGGPPKPARPPSPPRTPNPQQQQQQHPLQRRISNPVPPPDIIAMLDPASAGGGGPLRRITTAQRERAASDAAGMSRRATVSGMTRRASVTAWRDREKTGQGQGQGGLAPLESARSEKDLDLSGPAAAAAADGAVGGQEEEEVEEEEYVYPEGGYGWVVLAMCVLLASVTMGWGMNYGVFQDYYATVAFKGTSSAYISVTGTISAFMMNGSGMVFGRLGDRYGYKRILYISCFVTWVGLFSAAFSTEVWHLFITQGVLTGGGMGMAVPLFMSLPSQWFYRRRGLASGVALSGTGIGGGTSILILRKILPLLGYKKTLMICACFNLALSLVATTLIRTRPASPEAQGKGKGPWVDMNVVRTGSFWSLSISLVVATAGYGQPWLYLQQWVLVHNPNTATILSALPVSILCFSVVVGRTLVGFVADLIGPFNTYICVFCLSAVTQLVLWLTAKTFAQAIAFAIVYGIVAPGFLGILPQIVIILFGPNNLASNVGLVLFFNGPGNLAGGPIAGAIFDRSGRTTFKYVIITDAILQFTGAAIAVYARLKASRRLFEKV